MATKQKTNGNNGGGNKGGNGPGNSKPILDSATQDRIRRDAKKGKNKARGMHVETMTSGLVADERKRRQEVAEIAVTQLNADAIKLRKELDSADKSRRGQINGTLNATLAAIPLVEAFGADPLMKFRTRGYAFSQVGIDRGKAGFLARVALKQADKEVTATR